VQANSLSARLRSRTDRRVLAGLLIATAAIAATAISGCSPNTQAAKPSTPFLVIAHRGASAQRPEHTLAAYQLAIEQGADFIELDLVPTADGALIARHENALAVVALSANNQIELDDAGQPRVLQATTDVATRGEFADRLVVKVVDGYTVGGWFSEDFTLAEIRTLWARERIPSIRPENVKFNDTFRVPTLADVIGLLQTQAQQPNGPDVGLYIELKHPTFFSKNGRQLSGEPIAQDTAQLLVDQLLEHGFTEPSRLFLQCFEIETLRRLQHDLLPAAGFDAPLVQLYGGFRRDSAPFDVTYHRGKGAELSTIYGPLAGHLAETPTYSALANADVLATIGSDYAEGVGPSKNDLAVLAKGALAAGLEIHPYTVRPEAFFLDPQRGGLASTAENELKVLRDLGATGVFIDQPAIAINLGLD